MNAGARLQIGDWYVDPTTNELSRGGQVTRVEPKAMDVLLLLAKHAGAVVSREEFLSKVWPGLVVGDEALSQSITKLRRAFGDDPRAPSYIETISKRGYRLTAPVRGGDATPAATRTRARPAWLAWGSAAVVVLLVAAGFYFVSRPVVAPAPASPDNERQDAWVTVTVLPFESSGAPGGEAYFARGISDNLTTDLAHLSDLRMVSASGVGPEQAARAARYLVSGSVQRDSATLRINVHLVDTRTRQELWSERFTRPAGDLFAVQDEIVRKLAQVLPAKVSDAERQRLAKRYTRSLEAYDAFLHAQALFLVRAPRENEEARALYRKAIELDPKFARAYSGLAMTYAMDQRLHWTADAALSQQRAWELAESARLIDPDIAEVHWALGFIHAQGRRHQQAIASLQRAIELNPSFADAHALMGGVYTYVGEPAKSISLLRAAMRFNPDGGYLYFLLLGRAYLFQNDIEQALINLREAVARNPVDLESHLYLAAASMAAGDLSAAEWEAEEVRSLEPGFSVRSWLGTYPMTSEPQRAKLQELLARTGL